MVGGIDFRSIINHLSSSFLLSLMVLFPTPPHVVTISDSHSLGLLSPTHTRVCVTSPPAGCGGGGRGELHHAVLHPDGRRGLSHPDRDAGHLLPGGTVPQRLHHQAPQTGHLRPGHLPRHGVPHPSLLPGRHTGRTQGRWSFQLNVGISASCLMTRGRPDEKCLWVTRLLTRRSSCSQAQNKPYPSPDAAVVSFCLIPLSTYAQDR